MTRRYYEILEVSETATPEKIKAAYRKLALKWHPDKRGNSEEANKKMRDINEAFEALNNGKGSVTKYGYDYGEEIEEGELAVSKYLNNIESMNEAWQQLSFFYADTDGFRTKEHKIVSDYHLIRAKNLLKILDSYYKPKYLAAKNEDDRCEVVKFFRAWDNSSGESNEKAWKNNFERLKRMLNFALRKLELPELNDQDLQIKGSKDKKPVEDGVVDIKEYNKLWVEQNHAEIDKYLKTRGKIYDTNADYSKYQAVNPTLFAEMDAKATEAENGSFRSIWETDKPEKISEVKRFNEHKLEKMKEAMKLMENLIEEGKNYKPNGSTEKEEKQKNQDTPTPQSHETKKKEESEIYQEVAKKEKEINDKLERLTSEAQTLNDYEALEAKIKEIDKYQGEIAYESGQTVINQLKVKLANLDKDKFKQGSKQRVENLIENNEVKKDDLSKETQQALAELENEKDVEKINELENIVSEEVNEKKAKNKLEQLLQKAEEVLREGARATIEQIQKIKKDLHSFHHSNNKFNSLALETKKDEFREVMIKLENYSNNTPSVKPSFLRPAVIIPTTLVTVAGLGFIILMLAKNRRINKRKTSSKT